MNLNENLLKQIETSENKQNAALVYSLIEYRLQQVSTEEKQKPFFENTYWVCINFYTQQEQFEFMSREEIQGGLKTLIKFGFLREKTKINKYYYSKTNKCLSL